MRISVFGTALVATVALAAEGSGVGACNPPLAHQALQLETEIGLLLPYNVIVYATEAPNRTAVAALDPEAALRLTGRTDIAPLAAEVKGRLRRVLEAVGRAI